MDPFSGFQLDPRARMPMTEQIKRHVLEQVRSGRYPAGQRLPSMQKVARSLNVSMTTVVRAFRDLRIEGRIAGRAGQGTFVCPVPTPEQTTSLRMSPSRILTAAERERVAGVFTGRHPEATLTLTDDAPDLLEVDLNMLSGVAHELEDVDDLVCELYGRAQRGREVFDPLRENGRLHMLPVVWGHKVVLLNKEMFRAAGVPLPTAGWGWEEALETARGLAQPERGVYAFASGQPASVFLTAVLQNGGSLFDRSGRHCRLAEPEAVEAASYIRRLGAYGPPAVRAPAEVQQDFSQGRLAMRVSSNWSYGSLRNYGFEVALRPLPQGRLNTEILGASGFGIRRGSPARSLAIEMLRALAGIETWPDYVARRPADPFTLGLQDSNEAVDVCLESLRHGRCVLHQIEPALRRACHIEALKLIPNAVAAIEHSDRRIPEILVQLRDQMNAIIEPGDTEGFGRFREA